MTKRTTAYPTILSLSQARERRCLAERGGADQYPAEAGREPSLSLFPNPSSPLLRSGEGSGRWGLGPDSPSGPKGELTAYETVCLELLKRARRPKTAEEIYRELYLLCGDDWFEPAVKAVLRALLQAGLIRKVRQSRGALSRYLPADCPALRLCH